MSASKLDLEAIRKRAEVATEGHWYCVDLNGFYISPDIEDGVEIAEAYSQADADFIANARQDVPALIAEVERLRNALWEITVYPAEDALEIAEEALNHGEEELRG